MIKKNQIFSHRGMWTCKEEQNTKSALFMALDKGFSVETDIRDEVNEIIIKHDAFEEKRSKILITEILEQLKEYKNPAAPIIGLNVKSCGLSERMKKYIDALSIKNDRYYFFDMAIADSLSYKKAGLSYYSRTSEIETLANIKSDHNGVWIDNFSGKYDQLCALEATIRNHKCGCIVSPELHRRDHLPLWCKIKEKGFHRHHLFQICTDYPENAFSFFSEE